MITEGATQLVSSILQVGQLLVEGAMKFSGGPTRRGVVCMPKSVHRHFELPCTQPVDEKLAFFPIITQRNHTLAFPERPFIEVIEVDRRHHA
jgi:hypothetical protein